MIIKVHKFLFFGVKEDLSSFFEKAQGQGFIEFIGSSSKMKEFPPFLKNYVTAIKILKQLPVAEKVEEEALKLNDDAVCDKIVQIVNNIEHLEEIRRSLIEEAKTTGPFGNFSLEDVEYIEEEGKRIFQFFVIKSGKKKKIQKPEDLIYINTEYDLDYFIAINKEKKQYPGYIEIFIEKPVGLLKKRIEAIDVQIGKYREKLRALNIYLKRLKVAILEKLNAYNLAIARNTVKNRLDDALFSVEAFVPENKIEDLKKLIEGFAIDYEQIAIEKSETVPTYIENKGTAAIGEDIVKIYDAPSTQDKDPSLWVLSFFTLFFAIIISDAGYGLLFLIASFFARYKIKNPKPIVQRMTKLCIILSSACVIWGVFSASYFGINISPKSPLQKVSIIYYLSEKRADFHLENKDETYREWVKDYPSIAQAKNGEEFLLRAQDKTGNFQAVEVFGRNVLMELSLLIGALHIITAFGRNVKRNLAGIGWIIFIIGGYLYFPSFVETPTMINFLNILSENTAYKWGFFLIFFGLSTAVVLSIFQNKLKGISEITAVSGIFGDILSYLRIYALALAGMIVSQTFNQMASSITLSYSAILGFFVLLFGHSINILMSTMGGVIHGLRLNFLEWYNHCFEGGGKIFNPLKLFK